jgi:ferrous iron transport protein B
VAIRSASPLVPCEPPRHGPLRIGDFSPIIDKRDATPALSTLEPLVRPLGFDWKIGIGLVTSLAAREVIVGTLGTIYGMEGASHSAGLQAALRHDLTPGGAVALLVFFAFAMQCASTIAVVRRETGGWRWPAIQFAWMTLHAYAGAFVANRLVTALFA